MWLYAGIVLGLSVLDMCRGQTASTTVSPGQSTGTSLASVSPEPKVTTDPPFQPVSPSKPVKYVMQLENSGPAVLDSSIEFRAQLFVVDGVEEDVEKTKFVYQWMSMADMTVHTTEGHLNSKLKLTFPSDSVTPGEFLITVAAFFKEDAKKIAAFQVSKFLLTEKLNGQLILQQTLEYQRFANVLSTNRPTVLIANVRDHFQAQYNLSYEYFWYNNGEFIKDTEDPVISTVVGKPTNSTLMTLIIADFSEKKESSTKLSRHKFVPAQMLDHSEPLMKNGQFKQQVIFKDGLQDCEVVRVDAEPGDRTVEVGLPFYINITCLGSGPSSVCLNVTAYNSSIPPGKCCRPTTFIDSLEHQVNLTLNSSGWADVHFYVYNDVSRSYTVKSFFGYYNPDSVDVPALVFPTVFGTLGVVVIILGAVYIMRLRKKPLVEVADFDFHPNLTSSGRQETGRGLGRLTNSLKYLLFRSRYSPEQRQPRLSKQDSLTEETTDVKSLYGSL